MEARSSPQLYGEHTKERGDAGHIYENSLLALCRAAMLRTRTKREDSDKHQDDTCMRCGMEPETMHHVIFECNDKY